MGSPGHFRIPGHSGTDVKHKKAFTRIKEYYRNRTSTSLSSKSARTGHAENHKTRSRYKGKRVQNLIVRSLQISLFLLVVVGGVLIVKNLHLRSSVGVGPILDRLEKKNKAEVQTAYKLWVKEANDHLKANELAYAQRDYIRAIRIYKYGKAGRIGLTEVLMRRCHSEGVYCEEAEEHLTFVREMNYLSETEQHELLHRSKQYQP